MTNKKQVTIEHFDSDDTWNICAENGQILEPDFETEAEAVKHCNENDWEIRYLFR